MGQRVTQVWGWDRPLVGRKKPNPQELKERRAKAAARRADRLAMARERGQVYKDRYNAAIEED